MLSSSSYTLSLATLTLRLMNSKLVFLCSRTNHQEIYSRSLRILLNT